MFNSNPFGSNINDLQNLYLQLMLVLQQVKAALLQSLPILEEINKEVNSLSSDELTILAGTNEYLIAKLTYEAGFMLFLGNKFSQEYILTPEGKTAAENLLNTIKKSKEYIQSLIKAKEEKVNTLLNLVESDPEFKKKFDELMLKKNS